MALAKRSVHEGTSSESFKREEANVSGCISLLLERLKICEYG